jgi:predicted metal-dependent peptidase
MTNLTPEQRIQRSHVQLMRSPKFAQLSGIMMLGDSKVVDDMPTAATDGWNKMYGRAFLSTLNEPQLNFVVAHENFHVLFKHLTTWKKLSEENHQLANMACDYVINLMIRDLDPNGELTEIPPCGALLDEQYRGWDAGQVFEHLKKNPPPKGKGQSMDDHQWGGAKQMTDKERAEMEKQIDQAIRQGSIVAGKMNGKTARDIGALPEPKVNWREQLRDFVTSVTSGRDASTWRKPNRRWLAQGMYMPSPYAESIGPVVVGVDTSASISQADIAAFLAEIKSITDTMPPERLHLLYWDTKIAREETYVAGDYAALETSTRPAGGGGTDPRCVQDYVHRMNTQPDFVLMLSDGYIGNWPNFNLPTMWAMTTNETAPNAVNIKLN